MPLICKIKKDFGSFILDTNIETNDEIRAILGASGCGKSMTLKCITGIVKPDSGEIILNGTTLFSSTKKINLPPQKRCTGLLFQDYALFPNMTVSKNISIGVNKFKKKFTQKVVNEMISKFQLDGLENRYPYQLSGGQKQRCALARIMAGDPEILMLDEPFSALDSYLKWQLEQEIKTTITNLKKPVLFVSHNRDEVYRLCDSITVMNNGQCELTSDKWELFKNPQTYTSALLTGCKNIALAEVKDNTIYCNEFGISCTLDYPIIHDIKYIGLRAKQLIPAYKIHNLSRKDYLIFDYEIVSEMEDTFSYILMVKKKNSNCKAIRWELLKKERYLLDKYPLQIAIHKENILLLKSS